MRKIYDHLTRTVGRNIVRKQSNSVPAEDAASDGGASNARDATEAYVGDKLDFRFDDCDKPNDEDNIDRRRKSVKGRTRPAKGSSCADYWEFVQSESKWVYHHISYRKQMFVPTGGDEVLSVLTFVLLK